MEPTQAVPQMNTNELWICKHRNVMRKMVVEERWVLRRMYDIGWSGEKSVGDATVKKARRSIRLYHCSFWKGSQEPVLRGFGRNGNTGQKRPRAVTGVESQLSVRRWESEKHRNIIIPVAGFRMHVTNDGSLFGVSFR